MIKVAEINENYLTDRNQQLLMDYSKPDKEQHNNAGDNSVNPPNPEAVFF
jgi:hypothetical protein